MAIAAQRSGEQHELVIDRVFDAPQDLVFKAWTDPHHAIQWWGPKAYPSSHMEMDARRGGVWRGCLKSVETGEELWLGGVFREVVFPGRLVFTFAWEEEGERGLETLVTVTFAEEGGRTRMLLRQAPFQSAAERDGHNEGWSGALDRLDEFLAQQAH